jgi:hypothetical protein
MNVKIRCCARLLAPFALAGASVSAQRGGPIAQQLRFAPYHARGVGTARTNDILERLVRGGTFTPKAFVPERR